MASPAKVFDDLFLNEDSKKESTYVPPPQIDARRLLVNGELQEWTGKFAEVHSPIFDRATGRFRVIDYYRLYGSLADQENPLFSVVFLCRTVMQPQKVIRHHSRSNNLISRPSSRRRSSKGLRLREGKLATCSTR